MSRYDLPQTPAVPARRPLYRGPGVEPLSNTTCLIIANVVIYYLVVTDRFFHYWLLNYGVMQPEAVLRGEVWRLWTATFLHAHLGHLGLNMLGLYFLGPALERVWGPRQFFLVYTLGGIAGNIMITLAGVIGFLDPTSIAVGASGSVLTLLGAAAVLFPDAEVYVYFILPVRIRTFTVVYGVWFIYNIIQRGSNYGGDICHLAGLIVGLIWAWVGGVSISGRHRTTVAADSLVGKLTRRLRRHDEGL